MTDLSPMIRDAFQDDSLPAADRDRLWSTMRHRQARQARAKLLVRASLLLLAMFAIVAAVYAVIRSSSDPVVSVPVAADSISINSPVERSMTQGTHEVPSDLIPLLGHRSQLMMDMQRLETRQLELAQVLNRTPPGTEHDVAGRQLRSVEQQLEATRVAVSVIDAQLAGQPVPVPAVPAFPMTEFPPPQVIVNPGLSDELIWASGGPAILVGLAVIAMLGYMRRIARKTREALAAIERQVSSQHATLASGIDAIAVEVERLGEGQRFMSKVLAGSEAKPVPINRT